jgi:L-iditol 2-dehydrogenase
VKVRLRAAGVCGSDLPRVLHNGAHFYPVVLGHEFAGDVVETGEDVKDLHMGDRVSGAPLLPCMSCDDCLRGDYALCKNYSFIGSREQGSFAEYVVLPEKNAVRFDPGIPYEQAAMFEPSTVALHGLFLNGYKGGGNVAVLGGGTIGLFTMQWAKIFGAKHVVVYDVDAGRLALAARLGADDTVNTGGVDDFPGESRFDYVFETAGNTVTMRQAFRLAGNRSHICMIGTPHTDLLFTPELWERMNRKEFRLTGSWMSYSAPFPGREWTLTAHYFQTGQLRFDDALIYRKLPLSACAEAFALFETPGGVHGKVMFIVE